MDFLKRLFGGGQPADDGALHLYVKCGRCGAPVHLRINPQNELAADYGDDGADGYILVKDVVDDRCFQRMRAELRFDGRRREISREIERGAFIDREEYESLLAERNAGRSSAA
jgi:hypothetical protein